MFKLQKNPTFTHDVPVQVPVDMTDDNGGHETRPLKVRFRVLHSDDLAQHDYSSREGQEAYLRAIVDGFPAVADDQGNVLPDDDALFHQLAGLSFVRLAVMAAYNDAVIVARAKN